VSRSMRRTALTGWCVAFLLLGCLPESEEIPSDSIPSDGKLSVMAEGEKGLKRLDPRNGWWPSAAFSDDGVLHVGWCNGRTGQVWYARQGLDGHWTKEPVDTSPGAGRYVTMALDRNGRPMFAYQVQEEKLYRFLRQTPTGWQQETISKEDGDGRGAQLAEGPDGTIHLIYYDVNIGLHHAQRGKDGRWTHETITDEAQGAHTLRPALHIHDDGRITLLFADARFVKTGLRRAERDRAGKWTLSTVDKLYSPGRSVAFVGPAKDPTASWVYSVNGKAWIKLGERGRSPRLLARKASFVRALLDMAGKPVILTGGTDRSLTHLTRHAYLIRYDQRHGKFRHFKIGDANVVHSDLAVSKTGRIVSVFTDETDGTMYLHELGPDQY